MHMTARVTCLWVVAILLVACQKSEDRGLTRFVEGRQTFRELLALRDQISKEFQETVADVNIAANDRMTVKFINSPLSSRTREEKQQRADAVAAFVLKTYKHPLSSVSVQFVSETAGAGTSAETYVGRPTVQP